MESWTLETAKNRFSELVRRALAHVPQVVVRGGRADEAVVIIARSDYERLVAPVRIVEFFRDSPLARAVAAGAFGDPATADPFPRVSGRARNIALE